MYFLGVHLTIHKLLFGIYIVVDYQFAWFFRYFIWNSKHRREFRALIDVVVVVVVNINKSKLLLVIRMKSKVRRQLYPQNDDYFLPIVCVTIGNKCDLRNEINMYVHGRIVWLPCRIYGTHQCGSDESAQFALFFLFHFFFFQLK